MKTNINSQALKLAHKLKALYARASFYRALREAYNLLKSEKALTDFTTKLEIMLGIVRLDSTKNVISKVLDELHYLWFTLYVPVSLV